MNRFVPLFFFAGTTFGHLAVISPVHAAQHRVELRIHQRPTTTGGLEYALSSQQTVTAVTNFQGKLIAPDGSEFMADGELTPIGNFDALAAKLFGTWTSVEKYDGGDVSYPFEFAPFALADVFSDTPEILSPAPGSNIPMNFKLNWKWKNGGTTRGLGINHFDIKTSPNLDIDFDGSGSCCYSTPFELRREAPGAGWVDLRVGGDTRISVGTISELPVPGDEFSWSFAFRTQSELVRYNVVPEPSSLSLFFVLIGGLVLRSRTSAGAQIDWPLMLYWSSVCVWPARLSRQRHNSV